MTPSEMKPLSAEWLNHLSALCATQREFDDPGVMLTIDEIESLIAMARLSLRDEREIDEEWLRENGFTPSQFEVQIIYNEWAKPLGEGRWVRVRHSTLNLWSVGFSHCQYKRKFVEFWFPLKSSILRSQLSDLVAALGGNQ
jgi:hypothetical protein